MEFYSSIKKYEILLFTSKWKELESINLSEISQVQKVKGHLFSLMCGRQIQYKSKHYCIYIQIFAKHVSKRGLLEETKGRRKGQMIESE
jgi:hypothetical protein